MLTSLSLNENTIYYKQLQVLTNTDYIAVITTQEARKPHFHLKKQNLNLHLDSRPQLSKVQSITTP